MHCLLTPTKEEIISAPSLNILSEKVAYGTWGELATGGIKEQTKIALSCYDCFEENGTTRFSSRDLSIGISNPASYNDFHVVINNNYLLDQENKGSEGSIFDALRQAAVSCSNFSISLLRRGVPWYDIVVPGIANTGLAMIFGATIILEESFPTFIPISKVLILSDSLENRIASAYIQKAYKFCKDFTQDMSTRKLVKKNVKNMLLDTDKYFIKTLNPDILDRGLGLFGNMKDPTDCFAGFTHMIRCLNLIFDSPARQYAEYPISLRTPDADIADSYYRIIYRDLKSLGFKCGTPNRNTSPALYSKFVEILIVALQNIHAANVIHVDLYASNIMHKISSTGEIEIRIIDWDAAHCLDEGDFNERVKERLIGYLGDNIVNFGISHDELYLSAYKLEIDEVNSDVWNKMASGEKKDVDEGYRYLMDLVIFQKMASKIRIGETKM